MEEYKIVTQRERLVRAYLESDSPDMEEIIELMQLSDKDIKTLYHLWEEVQAHDGCISNEDSVRLSLYLHNNGVRKDQSITLINSQ